MTYAETRTSVPDRPRVVDSEAWFGIVDALLPAIWQAALDQRLSAADAAVVCDATLLSLLDGWATAEYGSDNVLAMPILAAAAQGRAAVECARTARLNERRAAVATSVNDLVLREAASPAEGHSGVLAEASAADRSPVISTSEKSLNGPAEPDTTSAELLLSAAD